MTESDHKLSTTVVCSFPASHNQVISISTQGQGFTSQFIMSVQVASPQRKFLGHNLTVKLLKVVINTNTVIQAIL